MLCLAQRTMGVENSILMWYTASQHLRKCCWITETHPHCGGDHRVTTTNQVHPTTHECAYIIIQAAFVLFIACTPIILF